MSQLISAVTVVSLLVTAVYAVGSYLLAQILGKKVSQLEKWILTWLIFDVLIHFTLVRLSKYDRKYHKQIR